MKAKCFNEDEKRLMVERVRANETGIQNKVYKRYQAIEAITDPIVWLYVTLQLTSTLVIGGLGVFSNLIIASFGFTYLETQLLNIAQGAVTIIVMVGSAALCTWTNQTAWVMHVSSFTKLSHVKIQWIELLLTVAISLGMDHVRTTVIKSFPIWEKSLLIVYQKTSNHRNCYNLPHRAHSVHTRRPPHCLLLHAVLPG